MKNKRMTIRVAVALAAALTVGTFCVSAKTTLTDMDGHWAYEYVDYGVQKGYINGYEDGSFQPEKSVSRAEFAKMLNTAIGITKKESIDFTDVAENAWYYDEVRKAVYAGCINGYEDGSFLPNNSITRQEAAVILSRIALRAEQKRSLDDFADADDIASWAKEAFTLAYSKGFITGDDTGHLHPDGVLTRAQAAKIIYSFLESENIHNGTYTVSTANATCSETLFTDDVVFSASTRNISLTLDGCRVLGTVRVSGSSAEPVVSICDSAVALMETAEGSEPSQITLSDDASVKYLRLESPARLAGDGFGTVYVLGDDMLSGTVEFDTEPETVMLSASSIISSKKLPKVVISQKGSYTFQRGAVEELSVSAVAAGSVITLSGSANVDEATVEGAVSFMGSGTIALANNRVSGVTYETKPQKQTGQTVGNDDTESGPSTGASFQPNSVLPSKNATNVAVSSDIELYYSLPLTDSDGDTVTSSYLKKNIEIHRGTASGAEIDFDAALNSTRRRITLVPNDNLDYGTKYYVVIAKGAFTDPDGNSSGAVSYYFTTKKSSSTGSSTGSTGTTSADITYTPKNAATDVSVTDSFKITFDKTIKDLDGNTPTTSYLSREAIELREKTTSGTKISITATLSSSGRVVTVKPEEALKSGTRYYLYVLANKLKTSSGSKIAKDYIYFTTSDELNATMTPASGATGVALDSVLTLEFNSPVTRPSGSNVTSTYLNEQVVELHKSSAGGTKIDFTASISSDKKTVTIVPSELVAGTKYYVVIPAGKLASENGAENEKISLYFTTAGVMAPSFEPVTGSTGVPVTDDVVIKFNEPLFDSSKKPITADYVKEKVVTFKKTNSSGTAIAFNVQISEDYTTITLKPTKTLSQNTTYYVSVARNTLYNEAKKGNTAGTCTFKTDYTNSIEFSPYNGETDVAVSSKIQLTLEHPMYQIGGAELTKDYVNKIVELRKDSYDGEAVTFTAALTSDKKTITLTPKSKLAGDTTYVIVVREATLEDADGDESPQYVSQFTTEETVSNVVTITPANRATEVSLTTDITFEFESAVYRSANNTPSDAYLVNNVFQIRKGSSSSGDKIAFTAALSSNNKTITLTPSEPLEASARYYVLMAANTLQYSDGTKVSAKTIYFNTNDGKPVVEKLEKLEMGASYALLNVKANMDGSLHITAEDASGKTVSELTTSVKAGKLTEIEVGNLASNTAYTIKAVVTSEEGRVSAVKSLAVKTTEPFAMTIGAVTDTSATVTIKALCKGKLKLSYGDTVYVDGLSFIKDQSRDICIEGLNAGTEYKLTAEFTDPQDKTYTLQQNIKTAAKRALAIDELIVVVGEDRYSATLEGDKFSVTIMTDEPNVTLIGQTSFDDAVFVYNDGEEIEPGEESQPIPVTAGEIATVNVLLKAPGGESVSGVITIKCNKK